MLDPGDRMELPDGVGIDGDTVSDHVRGAVFPANETALFVLRRAGRPLGLIAAELAELHGIDGQRARDDVLRFAFSLNRELLANVVRGGGPVRRFRLWLRLALRVAPAGAIPALPARRAALDTSTPLQAAIDTLAALRRRSLVLAVTAVLLAAPGAVTPGAIAVGAGVGAGFAIHEAGHAALLGGTGAALVVSGLRTYVLHAPLPPARQRRVAAAGPLAAAALGVTAVTAAWLVGLPELSPLGCAPAAHALGLTVATGDGRTACGL